MTVVYDPMNTPNPYNQPIKRKRRAWPWILASVVAVLAICGIGSAVLIGGTATAVKHEQTSRAADIKLTGCTKTVINTVEVTYTLVNSSSTAQSYAPEIRVEDAAGTIVGSANDFTPSVPAGATYKGKAVGTLDDGATKFTCKLVGS